MSGRFVTCETCFGLGYLFIADTCEGELEDRCPDCHGAREVWVKAPGVRDTVPAPAPEGCEEAS